MPGKKFGEIVANLLFSLWQGDIFKNISSASISISSRNKTRADDEL